MLGTPRGVTWYLHPVVHNAAFGNYVLDPKRRYAASGRDAEIPAEARRAVQEWGFGSRDRVPARARVHNFQL